MDLAQFIGEQLVGAIARLRASSFAGPWPATLRARAYHERLRPKFFYAEDHAHDHVELCHLLSGRCILSIRRKLYRFQGGDLGFFPPQLPHAETYARPETPYRLAWWIFHARYVLLHVTDYTRRAGFRMVDRVVLNHHDQDFRDACGRLRRFIQGPRVPPLMPVKEALLTLTVLLLRRVMAGSEAERSQARHTVIEQAQRFIQANLEGPIILTEVARAVLLSPNYLTTLFRTETGHSLGSYIRRQRVGRAKVLLETTPRSIKEIAHTLGFEDPYVFSRTFKRVEGVAPLHYRRRAAR